MDIPSRLSAVGSERGLFAIGAILTGALTVVVFRTGNQNQGLLYAAFSLYLGGAATPAIRDNVPEYKRTGAITLAGVGMAAILLGIQSPISMLFVIGGIAAVMRLF
jgi:hypothetical protein